MKNNTENFILAKSAEDWYPYCDGINYAHNATRMIAIFDRFSQLCAKANEGFNDRLAEVQIEGQEEEITFGFEDEPVDLFDTLSCFEDEDYLLFRPEELANVEYQKLFRNIFAYESAIKILEYDIQEGKYGDIEMSLKTKKILQSVYKFLARITYKQDKTKKIL